MRAIDKLKICGIAYLLLDAAIQVYGLFILDVNLWIYEYSLYNSFLMLCFAATFSESNLVVWLALLGMLTFMILSIYVLITFIRRKGNFLIPLIMMLLNIIIHIVAYWDIPYSYVGLLYKIIGCAIFICILRMEHMNRKEDRLRENSL